MRHTEIAIIGAACNLPKASDIRDFWNLILSGEVTISRQNGDEQELPDFLKRSGEYVPIASNLLANDIETFDAEFWGISPKDAALMDPQHKKALECAWHALEDACIASDSTNKKIGVYGSSSVNNYIECNIASHPEVLNSVGLYQLMLGNCPEFLASRISYKLGLKGPSLSFHSACSSSLVALHYAYLDLINNQCDVALVVSSSIRLPHSLGYMYEESGIFSKQGHCLPFDARADGTVPGSGVVALVLKRISSALPERRNIYAIIRGGAINNDGKEKVGYTAPSFSSQVSLYQSALSSTETNPQNISYIETHGTGTRIGDPIEYTSLNQVYGSYPIAIGTLKAQLGHLDAASGLAGVLKLALMLHHNVIPSTAHIKQINPLVSDISTNLYFPKKETKFPLGKSLAAISSFGLGGTNAHFILEGVLNRRNHCRKTKENFPFYTIPLSAKNEASLMQIIDNLYSFIKKDSGISIEDLSYSLWKGRTHFEYRCIFMVRSIQELESELIDFIQLPTIPYSNFNRSYSTIKKLYISSDSSDCDIYQLPYCWKLSQYSNLSEISITQILSSLKDIKQNSLMRYISDNDSSALDSTLCLNKETLFSGEFASKAECFLFLNKNEICLHQGLDSYLISLPGYPFQKQRHWMDRVKGERDNKKQATNTNFTEYTEEALLHIWEEVLGIKNVSYSDNFFEIGGDSLGAVRVLSILKKRYSIETDINFFLEIDTARDFFEQTKSLADYHNLYNSSDVIEFTKRSVTNNSLVVLLPPAGGSLICYRELVKLLCSRDEIAIIGIQYPNVLPYVPTITDIANRYSQSLTHYIKDVSDCNFRQVNIVGYSFGGNVGTEMCRILNQNMVNSNLFLIDSHPPIAYSDDIIDSDGLVHSFSTILAQMFKLDQVFHKHFRSESEMLSWYSELLNKKLSIEPDDFRRLYKIWKQNHHSLRGYKQKTLSSLSNFVVFNATEPEEESILESLSIRRVSKQEWLKIVDAGDRQVIDVNGNHYSILDKENVSAISDEILKKICLT